LSDPREYVLISAARNEERYIEATIESVANQTILPVHWIIVSDGSTDSTDRIVERSQRRYPFIRLVRLEGGQGRSFARQANALNAGVSLLADRSYSFIGMLDADITFSERYHERIFKRFAVNRRLGICGGFIHEKKHGRFVPRRNNSIGSVPGGIQMFSRPCFETIGRFVPLKYGGLDTYAAFVAIRNGFEVWSFPDIIAFHHRPTGGGRSQVIAAYHSGKMDRSLGYNPVYELLACARRLGGWPYLIGGVSKLLGYYTYHPLEETSRIDIDVRDYIRRLQGQAVRRFFLSPRSWRKSVLWGNQLGKQHEFSAK